MLTTLKDAAKIEIASVAVGNQSIDEMLNKEWLLTNKRGGFASGTVLDCNTRRYHGLLIGSLNPPANRITALAGCLESIFLDGSEFHLSSFEFKRKFSPQSFKYIHRFRRDIGVHFDYKLDKVELTKSLYLVPDSDTAAIVYDFTHIAEKINFVVRPFIGLRDFHSLQKSFANLYSVWLGDRLLVRHDVPGSCELILKSETMHFERDSQWWFNFLYRRDKQRGQDFCEDLWTPGFFKCRVDSPGKLILWASLGNGGTKADISKPDIEVLCKDMYSRQNNLLRQIEPKAEELKILCLASDQFIIKPQRLGKEDTTSILAGFPWFLDWGRDAFVALPGLLLSQSRFDEAESVLAAFAETIEEGMIPNRFDDYSHTAHYNSIDASLWFIHAAFQYYYACEDSTIFTKKLLPAIRTVVESYHNGTKFGICADSDGLIIGGNPETQLTWMDAKYDQVPFTPRHGKAVEINALWYNVLCRLAEFYKDKADIETARHYGLMAKKSGASFRKLFWNESAPALYDCILPDGSADASLRPNQIFAVSLPFSPLSAQQQKQVVETVQRNLLTPYGLRTLNIEDERFRAEYTGPQQQRDAAYHQGTVWPYLIGPFIEAYLRVNKFSQQSKRQAAEFIKPLLEHLTDNGCLGNISEIFDGREPYEPRGCIAQAWSVAEVIRAYMLINS